MRRRTPTDISSSSSESMKYYPVCPQQIQHHCKLKLQMQKFSTWHELHLTPFQSMISNQQKWCQTSRFRFTSGVKYLKTRGDEDVACHLTSKFEVVRPCWLEPLLYPSINGTDQVATLSDIMKAPNHVWVVYTSRLPCLFSLGGVFKP